MTSSRTWNYAPPLAFVLLIVSAFSLATYLQPRVDGWSANLGSDNLLHILLGDGRQVLANHMAVKADMYFHSGYYPSIFDRQYAPTNTQHMTQNSNEVDHHDEHGHSQAEHDEEEHEKAMSFMGEPKDWIERFGRKFTISSHSHLTGGKAGEILPWLKLSAELDPKRIETYTVAAYWLRTELHKSLQAEQFLREGLRANPDSYEILFELGRLYSEDSHDLNRARRLWELSYKKWIQRESKKEKPDYLALAGITVRLAHLEQDQHNYSKALEWLALAKTASPSPESIQAQIDTLRGKIGSERK